MICFVNFLPCFQIRMEFLLNISELQSLTLRYTSEEARQSEDVDDQIGKVLETFLYHLSNDQTDQKYQIIVECLRCLRNAVVGVERIQTVVAKKILLEEEYLTDYIKDHVSRVQSVPIEEDLLSLRLGLQLMANLAVCRIGTQRHLLNNHLSLIHDVLSVVSDEKTVMIAAMIVHIFLTNEVMLTDSDRNFHANVSIFISPLSSSYKQGKTNVWTERCLELLFNSEDYLQHLSSEERVLLTDIIPFPAPEKMVKLLVGDFTYLTDIHLLITGWVKSLALSLLGIVIREYLQDDHKGVHSPGGSPHPRTHRVHHKVLRTRGAARETSEQQ